MTLPEHIRLHALWRLAIATGLRQGELLALGWDHIDLDAGTVTVEAQLQRVGGQWVRVKPKAARALKTLAIDAGTVAALRAHRLRMAAERTPEWRYPGLVFVTSKGEPYHGKAILEAFHAACDAAGIERRRFHDLRGSSSTLMAALGVPEDVRMARLGHAQKSTTRHYTKASEVVDRDAVERLSEALAG